MSKVYYFGWCTWMNPDELHRYWPEARIVTSGYVDNFAMEWRDASCRGDRGWCHLDNTPNSWGKRCLGIIVEIPAELYNEDFDDFVRISFTAMGDDGKVYNCWTYTLSDPGNSMKAPYFYWDNVVAGLNVQGFPYEYQRQVMDAYKNSGDCPRIDRPNPNPGRPGKSAAER